jgi:hypothetical protein
MIKNVVLVFSSGNQGISIKDAIKMMKDMATGKCTGKTEVSTKGNG